MKWIVVSVIVWLSGTIVALIMATDDEDWRPDAPTPQARALQQYQREIENMRLFWRFEVATLCVAIVLVFIPLFPKIAHLLQSSIEIK